MKERFGRDRVDALKRLLAGSASRAEALRTLSEKASGARKQLEKAPLVAMRRFEELTTGIERGATEATVAGSGDSGGSSIPSSRSS